jgi:hypothetical protein
MYAIPLANSLMNAAYLDRAGSLQHVSTSVIPGTNVISTPHPYSPVSAVHVRPWALSIIAIARIVGIICIGMVSVGVSDIVRPF